MRRNACARKWGTLGSNTHLLLQCNITIATFVQLPDAVRGGVPPFHKASQMLKGKNAVVTGSTSGIGLGMARALRQGRRQCLINGFGDAAEIEKERAGIEKEFGVKSLYSPADMTKPAEIAAMIRTRRRSSARSTSS